jgi:eukaryotic-like serine/threonine-protein kinase
MSHKSASEKLPEILLVRKHGHLSFSTDVLAPSLKYTSDLAILIEFPSFMLMIGTKLAHYEITSHLGSGGMGEVYQATDSKLGRTVAIKLLPEDFSHDNDRSARFEREARVLASLNHPCIAAIYGLEESSGRKFLVMELVGGKTLAERIKRGPIPMDEALRMATQIAEALEAAHEKGIIHRDLKPGNVMITPSGQMKVLDFGLAKVRQAQEDVASLSNSPTMITAAGPGMILGTAAYMSPEQTKGNDADRTADVWAFGCVLYDGLVARWAIRALSDFRSQDEK